MIISGDEQWFKQVESLAKDLLQVTEYYQAVQAVEAYLFNRNNWERLHETAHGRFIRELVTEVPDLTLRKLYREKVINHAKEERVKCTRSGFRWYVSRLASGWSSWWGRWRILH